MLHRAHAGWGWILNPFGVVNAVLDSLGLHGLTQNWLGDPNLALLSLMVVMVWLQLGYSLVVFMAGLARVDPSLYEAAEIDGASWLPRFRYVTIAMLRPEIFVVGLTTTIAALKVFAPIFVLTSGGPDNATIVPSYFSYYHFFSTNRVGYGAAIRPRRCCSPSCSRSSSCASSRSKPARRRGTKTGSAGVSKRSSFRRRGSAFQRSETCLVRRLWQCRAQHRRRVTTVSCEERLRRSHSICMRLDAPASDFPRDQGRVKSSLSPGTSCNGQIFCTVPSG